MSDRGALLLNEHPDEDPDERRKRMDVRSARIEGLEADASTFASDFWVRQSESWTVRMLDIGQALAKPSTDHDTTQMLRGRWAVYEELLSLPSSTDAELQRLRREAKEDAEDA